MCDPLSAILGLGGIAMQHFSQKSAADDSAAASAAALARQRTYRERANKAVEKALPEFRPSARAAKREQIERRTVSDLSRALRPARAAGVRTGVTGNVSKDYRDLKAERTASTTAKAAALAKLLGR